MAEPWPVNLKAPVTYDALTQALDIVIDRFAQQQRTIAALDARVTELERRPVPKYLGVWKADYQYSEGSFVTHDGSVWHCHKATGTRPGTSADWQLAVRGAK